MITGIGTDIVSINRIADIYIKSGEKFVRKILSDEELEVFSKRKNESTNQRSNYLAKRFAGKEAFSKALGTGIGAEISFKDISILKDEKGKPYIKISENSKSYEFLKDKKIHVSLSDQTEMSGDVSTGFALAFAVIET